MANNKQTVGELVYKITAENSNLKSELKKAEGSIDDLNKSAITSTQSVKGLDNTIDTLIKRAKELKAVMNSSVIGSEQFKKASTELGQVNAQLKNAGVGTDTLAGKFKSLVAGLGLAYLAQLAVSFGKASIQAYSNAQQSLIQYNNAQQNVAGTTKEQIEDLNEYIGLLEEKTTIDDKSIRQASQILAQDQIKVENQKKLLVGILDIAAANAKSNGTEIDATGTAIAIGRSVATGDVGALTRQNIVGIDEATISAFKLGDEAKRTAILVKLMADNGKGAADAYGQSWQGTINKAKDTVEDLQVAVGKGLSTALVVLTGGLSDTVGGLKIATDGTSKLGTAFVYVAGLANFMINAIKLIGISLLQTGNGFVQFVKISFGFASDVIGIFSRVRTAILSVGSAMKDVLTGNFKGAVDTLKDGFDFTGTFDRTSQAFASATESAGKLQDQFVKTTKDIGTNVGVMANASEVYKNAAAAQDRLTEAKDATAKAQAKEKSLTESQKEALKKLEEASDQYKNKFLDVVASIKSAVVGLNEDLKKSFKKFNEDIESNLKDGAENLVKIYVDAEEKVKDLKKQLSEVTGSEASDNKQRADINAQIKEQQTIIDSRVDYEKRQATVLADIKKKLADAGIDAEQSGLTALNTIVDLKAQIQAEEDLRKLGEFAREEEINRQKLFALTEQLIAEVTLTREKITKQEELEAELTDFLKLHNKIRKADVDAFANAAIAKYGEMAKALQSAISLQSQLNNLAGNVASTPKQQFAVGGYVGSKGGEVHPGEYVIPANMVRQMSGLVSQLEGARTGGNTTSISAPINIQANMSDKVDANTVAKEIAWELGRM